MTIVALPSLTPRFRRCAAAFALLALAASVAPSSNAQAPASPAPSQPAPASGAPPQPPGIPVSAVAAAKRDVPILLRNIGAIQASQSVLLRTRVDGTLEEVFFTEGQEVKRGDLLARVDPRPYKAVLDQAIARKAATQATLANARLDLVRSQDLVRNQFASRQQVDTRAATVAQLEATLRSDDAAIASAQVNLDYTSITAPFDGRVGLRLVDPGNVVRFADPTSVGIVGISQIRPIAAVFTLPQDALPAIQAAMAKGKLAVFARTPDDKTELGQGELLTVDNAMDATTGTIKLKAIFPNAETRMWPGQFVNVRLQLEIQRDVIAIPSSAVQRGPNGLFVYTVKPDSTAAIAPVVLGQDDGTTAVIVKGIDEGSRVIVAGQSRLQAGTRVNVAPSRPAS